MNDLHPAREAGVMLEERKGVKGTTLVISHGRRVLLMLTAIS